MNQELRQAAVLAQESLEEFDHSLSSWAAAYPVKVFPEPDFKKVAELLGDNLLTCVSASNMRHVVTKLDSIFAPCRAALSALSAVLEKQDSSHLAAPTGEARSGSGVPARPTLPGEDARPLVMTGYQLRAAAEFVNPDVGDTDQLETEVCLQWGPERDDGEGGKEPAGLRVWLADYPEEGSMTLDPDKPWQPANEHSAPALGRRLHTGVLAALEVLMKGDPSPDSPQGQGLSLLAEAVEQYEKSAFPDLALAASPLPQEGRTPLTKGQIAEIESKVWARTIDKGTTGAEYAMQLIRAIEAAHGIGTQGEQKP